MADEINIEFISKLANGFIKRQISKSFSLDQANAHVHRRTFRVPDQAGGDALPIIDVTTDGYAFFLNLGNSSDDTSDQKIRIGHRTGGTMFPMCELLPGQWAFWPVESTSILGVKAFGGTVFGPYLYYEVWGL